MRKDIDRRRKVVSMLRASKEAAKSAMKMLPMSHSNKTREREVLLNIEAACSSFEDFFKASEEAEGCWNR